MSAVSCHKGSVPFALSIFTQLTELFVEAAQKLLHILLKLHLLNLLLCPGRGVEYCDQFVCESVCLSVCKHISKTAGQIFTNFFVQFPVAMARSSSGGVALRYVLLVLWMTSRLAVMGRMAMGAIPGRSLKSMNALL